MDTGFPFLAPAMLQQLSLHEFLPSIPNVESEIRGPRVMK